MAAKPGRFGYSTAVRNWRRFLQAYFVRTTWVAWSVEACSVHL